MKERQLDFGWSVASAVSSAQHILTSRKRPLSLYSDISTESLSHIVRSDIPKQPHAGAVASDLSGGNVIRFSQCDLGTVHLVEELTLNPNSPQREPITQHSTVEPNVSTHRHTERDADVGKHDAVLCSSPTQSQQSHTTGIVTRRAAVPLCNVPSCQVLDITRHHKRIIGKNQIYVYCHP